MEENSIVIYAGVVIVSIIISLALAAGLTLSLKVREKRGRTRASAGRQAGSGPVSTGALYEELVLLQDDITNQRDAGMRMGRVRRMADQLEKTGAPQREALFQLKSLLDRYAADPEGLVLPLMGLLPRLRE